MRLSLFISHLAKCNSLSVNEMVKRFFALHRFALSRFRFLRESFFEEPLCIDSLNDPGGVWLWSQSIVPSNQINGGAGGISCAAIGCMLKPKSNKLVI